VCRSSAIGGRIDERDRRILLSGSGSDGTAETGPIVCACFGVGLPAIREAIAKGDATTVADIGKKLRAGTNCGSCIPELRAILGRVTEPA
jgi:assimilatory nitrate reductase catalytic subunit